VKTKIYGREAFQGYRHDQHIWQISRETEGPDKNLVK
jgi:hypothetical protein